MPARNDSPLLPMVSSKLKAKAAMKGLSVNDIERLIANFKNVLETELKKETLRDEAQKKSKIAKIKALMEESGLNAKDLEKVTGRGRRKKVAKKTRKKAAPKYRLMLSGAEHLWSGRGRPPTVFKDYMASGKSKESCAI